ncbi:GlsB/YeaQ/YmgE family stress response membrane protein [Kineococcus auxinigenes]|uniref:GlsB/YeaQ/YmgE family stress response membrane protein n=1 Tax=unclassified Kineococcus TaxID=2621656 RepID=UPI003D7EB07F
MITAIITAVIIGAIIGALARLVLPGRQNISILLTIVVGIIAAIIGTFLAQAVGVANTPRIDWIELILQVAVAAVGVTIVGSLSGRRR